MLYALRALKLYRPIFGDAIKKVCTCIDQPRLDSYDVWEISKDDLLAWGESIKPKAQAAFDGVGEYHAGSWCRFCRANGVCKAQAASQITAFDDFKDLAPAVLNPEQMSIALTKGATLVTWYEDLKKVALEKLLTGEKIPNYKIVEGRSVRAWTNQDMALEKLKESGIDKAIIYDIVPKSLAQLEKVIGATKFAELVGEFIIRPHGKPTLTNAEDPRKDYNSAVADFATVAPKGGET